MTNGSNGDHLQQIERLIESNSRAIAANSAAIAEVRDTLSEAVGRTLRAVDELREVVEEDRVNFREFMGTTQATLNSVNAAIEQQGKILDYLIRRDRNGNGDQPQ